MTTSLPPPSIATLAPLLALISTALGILIADLVRAPWRFSAWLALTGMTVTLALTLIVVLSGQSGTVQGMLNVDGQVALGTVFFCGAGVVTVLLELGSTGKEAGARYVLVTFAVTGAAIVAQSTHVLPLVIGLAILSAALVSLIGPSEGWRYYILQGAALASTLLGLAFLYAATGGLRADILSERLSRQVISGTHNPLAMLGIALLISGLGLPLGLVPFHMWVARISHRARASGTLLASLLLPGAAAIILSRLADVWPARARLLLITLGALSVLYGYTNALRSFHLRDVLAGVAIAQSGNLVFAATLEHKAGWAPLLWALAGQGVSLTCLWAVAISARREDASPLRLDDLAGLGNRWPWLAGAATLCVLNLAGLPPLIGATSQLLLFQSGIAQGYSLQVALATVGMLLAWLQVGRWMHTLWMRTSQERAWLPPSPEVTVVVLSMAGGMLLAGLYTQGILDWFATLSTSP
jgi:NADH-quinone oxidoreductase subunit N